MSKDKVALIIGAGDYLGSAIARRFAKEGFHAVGTRRRGNIVSFVKEIEDAGWKEVVRKSRKVVVNANAISRVIGRGGNNINAIRELSGAHIEVEKQSKGGGGGSQDRTILIKGSADSTRQASAWINAVIANPDKDLADIIGKPYRQLQAQQQSGTGLSIPPIMQQTVIVTNSGSTGMPNTISPTSCITSCRSATTAGHLSNSLTQGSVCNSSGTIGFTNLMTAKPNYTCLLYTSDAADE